MTKAELIDAISAKGNNTKKETDAFLANFTASIYEGLKADGVVSLGDFGKIKLVQRKERVGRNPQTQEPLTIPAKKVVVLTSSKATVETFNG
jgi:nucleoid DNA-binding protein